MNKKKGPMMDQLYSDVKYKGHICSIYHITKGNLNSTLLDNRRVEYNISKKYVNKRNQLSYEWFNYYYKKVMGSYSNNSMVFIGVSYLQNSPKVYPKKLENYIPLMMHICRNICMGLCFSFGLYMPMVALCDFKCHLILKMSQRIR